MDDGVKKLMHAYLDGELSPDEATALIAAVREDRAAARELSAHERLLGLAEAVPRPDVPPDFVARTLARAERAPQPSRLERLRARRIELSLGQLALAAAVVLALVAAPWLLHGHVGPSDDAGLVTVQFALSAPQARQVAVAGDFNGWQPQQTRLVRGADGTYRAQLRLPHGHYQYQFVVDGQRWVADPLAAQVVDDGFGGKNAVLDL